MHQRCVVPHLQCVIRLQMHASQCHKEASIPPEGKVECERPVAIHKDEEVDGGAQAHDEGAADGGGIQGCLMCQQGQDANDSQYHNDDAPCS